MLERLYEIQKATDDTLICIIQERLSNFPFIKELFTENDIAKIVSKKRSHDNELLVTLVLDHPECYKLLSEINSNLELLYSDKVIDNFKDKFQQWNINSFRSTIVELYFAAVFKKLKYSIQFEPKLPNGQRSEFLAKKGSITCYLEERTIHKEKTEKGQWITNELMNQLNTIDEPVALSIDITDNLEKNDVYDLVKYIRKRVKEEQSFTDSLQFSYDKKGVRLVEMTAYRLAPEENGFVSGFLYPGSMTIDWSDIRKKNSKKVSQLHPDYPGIIVVHPLSFDIMIYDILNAVFGDLAIGFNNNKLVRKQDRILKPSKNTRISAIIIHQRKTKMTGSEIENIVIFNRYADNPLPRDFLDFSLKEFKTLEQYNEELNEKERKKQDLVRSLHKHGVIKTANDYKDNGWQVKANIENWEIPEAIHKYIPDIVAKKDNCTLIIQITTCLSLVTRMDQESFLQAYAQRTDNTKYQLLIVDQDLTLKTEKEYGIKYLGEPFS